jgi:hypothetical protein
MIRLTAGSSASLLTPRFEGYIQLGLIVHLQVKNIGTRVMTLGIENEVALGDAFRLYVSVEDTGFVKHRTFQVIRIGSDHRTASR